MNGQIFKLGVPEHQAVQELLAWHASGKLAPDEAQRVARHVQTCAQCRQDLQWERELLDEARRTPLDDEASPGAAEAALAGLLPRLGAQEAVPMPAPAPLPWWRTLAANEPRWLRWTAVAQCVVIAGLALVLARPQSEPEGAYRAMGASDAMGVPDGAAAASGNVVVIFAPGATEQDLRRILQTQDARIVDGPTVTGAYVLSIPAAVRPQALQALRANAAIKLAEPLDNGAAP
jgi:anti-sigma factor RsiW